MKKLSKLALHSVAAVSAMSIFMSGTTQTAAAAEEWQVYTTYAANMLPTVIANDSSQVIVKLLVRDRDDDSDFINKTVYDWDQIEKSAAYDMRKGIVRNIAPGQWAQYNLGQEPMQPRMIGDNSTQRLVDVQVTLADGRVLELDKVDICTKDIVLTDEGLRAVNIAKKPSPTPDRVNVGSSYFHNHQPQGLKAAEPRKERG